VTRWEAATPHPRTSHYFFFFAAFFFFAISALTSSRCTAVGRHAALLLLPLLGRLLLRHGVGHPLP